MKLTALLLLLATLPVFSAPRIIDDPALRSDFEKKLAKLCDKGDSPTGEILAKQEADAPRQIRLGLPRAKGAANYEDAIQSVALLGRADHCGSKKCKKWHLRGVATAWCVGADGLFVTNYLLWSAQARRRQGSPTDGDQELCSGHRDSESSIAGKLIETLCPCPT